MNNLVEVLQGLVCRAFWPQARAQQEDAVDQSADGVDARAAGRGLSARHDGGDERESQEGMSGEAGDMPLRRQSEVALDESLLPSVIQNAKCPLGGVPAFE